MVAFLLTDWYNVRVTKFLGLQTCIKRRLVYQRNCFKMIDQLQERRNEHAN